MTKARQKMTGKENRQTEITESGRAGSGEQYPFCLRAPTRVELLVAEWEYRRSVVMC